MKHLIENNEVVMSGIPGHFTRKNGETFWGGYEKRTDLHYEDGWRDEEKPEFDPDLEKLGKPFLNTETDKVNYPVEAKELPPIEDVRTGLLRELSMKMDGFLVKISRAKLLYPDNADLDNVIAVIMGVKNQTVNDINTLELTALVKYKIRQEDVDYLNGLLEPFQL